MPRINTRNDNRRNNDKVYELKNLNVSPTVEISGDVKWCEATNAVSRILNSNELILSGNDSIKNIVQYLSSFDPIESLNIAKNMMSELSDSSKSVLEKISNNDIENLRSAGIDLDALSSYDDALIANNVYRAIYDSVTYKQLLLVAMKEANSYRDVLAAAINENLIEMDNSVHDKFVEIGLLDADEKQTGIVGLGAKPKTVSTKLGISKLPGKSGVFNDSFFSNNNNNNVAKPSIFGNSNNNAGNIFAKNNNVAKPSIFGNSRGGASNIFANNNNVTKPSIFGNNNNNARSMFAGVNDKLKASVLGDTSNVFGRVNNTNNNGSIFGKANNNKSSIFGNNNNTNGGKVNPFSNGVSGISVSGNRLK